MLNKVDLLEHSDTSGIDESLFEGFAGAKVSSIRGDGIHQLKTRMLERTVHGEGLARARRIV